MPIAPKRPAPKKRQPAVATRASTPPPALVKLALMAFALIATMTVVQSSGVTAKLFQ